MYTQTPQPHEVIAATSYLSITEICLLQLRCNRTFPCYLSVSMVIKVASDKGYFLSTVRFGNFRSIIAQTSNGWCCSGLSLAQDNCRWMQAGPQSPGKDAGLRFLWLSLAYSLASPFPRVKALCSVSGAFWDRRLSQQLGNFAGSHQLSCHLNKPCNQQLIYLLA